MNASFLTEVNYLAVIVAAVVTFLIGGVWYAPLFGKAWISAHGFSEEQVKALREKTKPPLFLGGILVCYFVMAWVIAVLFRAGAVQSAMTGIFWGLLLWGAVAALKMTDHIASGKQAAAFGIDAGFQLIAITVTTAILGAWK